MIERLKGDLRLLDTEWERNNVLRDEIEKLVNGVEDGPDTVSQLHEKVCYTIFFPSNLKFKLAHERSRIRIDSNSSSSSDGIHNYTTRDINEAFNCVSNFKKMLHPLIFHLKKLPQYLEGIDGISENSEFHELLRQITNITFDLDATINDVTGAIAGLEELERTLNRTSSPVIFGPPPTHAEKVTMDSLLNEVKTLRGKLNAEIINKNHVVNDLQSAQRKIDDLTIRVQELVDEKITLQNELRELDEDFDAIKEKYKMVRKGDDVEKLSEALIEARNSIKSKSRALIEANRELEQSKQAVSCKKSLEQFY